MCNGCGAPDHILKDCSSLENSIENGLAQVNTAYQRPINDPYAPTYNPGWRNHLNFSRSQCFNSGSHVLNQPYLRTNQAPTNPLRFGQEKRLNTLEKGLEVLLKSTSEITSTLNNFMQTIGQLLNTNTQAIAHLEMWLGQLATVVSEREKGRLPSQSETNPKNQNNQLPQQELHINQLNAIHTLRSKK